MLKGVLRQSRTAVVLLLFLSILTGLIYPLFVTLLANIFFPWQAQGSLVNLEGRTVGSILIGQSFTDAKYFWGRPSATTPFPYNAANSSGSNLGPSNPKLLNMVQSRVADLKAAHPQSKAQLPVDLVTASGSGLDPDISFSAALYQVPRVANARALSIEALQNLIYQQVQPRTFLILGEPRINVLQLNLMLDQMASVKP